MRWERKTLGSSESACFLGERSRGIQSGLTWAENFAGTSSLVSLYLSPPAEDLMSLNSRDG